MPAVKRAVFTLLVLCAACSPAILNSTPSTGGPCGDGDQDCVLCSGPDITWPCSSVDEQCGAEAPDKVDGECLPDVPIIDPGSYSARAPADAGTRQPRLVRGRPR